MRKTKLKQQKLQPPPSSISAQQPASPAASEPDEMRYYDTSLRNLPGAGAPLPKGAQTPTETQLPAAETQAPTPATRREETGDLDKKADPFQDLNEKLEALSSSESNSIHSVPNSTLIDSMVSIEPGRIRGGTVEINDDNTITVKGIEISDPESPAVKVTLNIVLSNTPNGIEAFTQRVNTTSARGFDTEKFEKALKTISSRVLSQTNKEISDRNPSWEARSVKIWNGMITVGFDKELDDVSSFLRRRT